MKKRLLPILLLITASFACQNQSEENRENKQYTLSPVKQVSITLDDETVYTSPIDFYSNAAGETFIYMGNFMNNTIYKYQYPEMTLVKKIAFQTDGPDAAYIDYMKGWGLAGEDSVINVFNKSVSLFGPNGKTITKGEFDGLDKDGNANTPMIYLYHQPVVKEGKAYLTKGWFLSPTSQLIHILDLKTGLWEYALDWPEEINLKWAKSGVTHWKNIAMTYNPQTEQFILGFNVSHDLYLTKDFKSFEKVLAKSEYISDITPPEKETDPSQMFAYYNKTSFYHGVYYDTYRDLYYRVATIAKPELINPEEARRVDQKSIIVLDKDFNKLTEMLLPMEGKSYQTMNIEITPEGLLIPYIEENTPENLWLADIFELKEME